MYGELGCFLNKRKTCNSIICSWFYFIITRLHVCLVIELHAIKLRHEPGLRCPFQQNNLRKCFNIVEFFHLSHYGAILVLLFRVIFSCSGEYSSLCFSEIDITLNIFLELQQNPLKVQLASQGINNFNLEINNSNASW